MNPEKVTFEIILGNNFSLEKINNNYVKINEKNIDIPSFEI